MFATKSLKECTRDLPGSMTRSYTLLDLLCVGIGGTVGSGIFILSGYVANSMAGPYTPVCWGISGVAAILSATSYAELSVRIPSSGSSYNYVYHTLGECPAYLSAFMLSLEFGVSSSAVSRSWGDKLTSWVRQLQAEGTSHSENMNPQGINLAAGAIQLLCVIVLLMGIHSSKITTNALTFLKMVLVLLMIVTAFILFDKDNLDTHTNNGNDDNHSTPHESVASSSGILRGATACYFGYIGFDEVVCLTREAITPSQMPIAVFGTIFLCTVLYILASTALVGMQPYREISSDSGFADAYLYNGQETIYHIVCVGELITLPLTILVSFLGQPRVMMALAQDNLCPNIFQETDGQGNLMKSIVINGIICIILALFVPFVYLESMVSAGILINFNLTNSSLLLMRRNDIVTNGTVHDGHGSSHNDGNSDDNEQPCVQYVAQFSRRMLLLLHRYYHQFTTIPFSYMTLLFIFHLIVFVLSIALVAMMNNQSIGQMVILSIVVTVGVVATGLCVLGLAYYVDAPDEHTHVSTNSREHRDGNDIPVPVRSDSIDISSDSSSYLVPTSPSPSHSSGDDNNTHISEVGDSIKDVVEPSPTSSTSFKVPLVPYLPLCATFINYFLLAQLPWVGMLYLLLYILLALICYRYNDIVQKFGCSSLKVTLSSSGQETNSHDDERANIAMQAVMNEEGAEEFEEIDLTSFHGHHKQSRDSGHTVVNALYHCSSSNGGFSSVNTNDDEDEDGL